MKAQEQQLPGRTLPVQSNNLAFLSVVLLLLVFIGKIYEIHPFFTKIHLAKLTVLFACAVVLLRRKEPNELKIISIPQVKLVLAIFSLSIISIPFSSWPRMSYDLVFGGYFKTLIFFLLLIKLVDTPKQLSRIPFIFSTVIFILALSSILLRTWWRTNYGSSYDPNDLAFIMVIAFPIIYYLLTNSSITKKIFLATVVVVLLRLVMITYSRGGLVGLVAASAILLLKNMRKSFAKTVVYLALGVFVFLNFTHGWYWKRMSTILNPQDDYNVTETYGRMEIWKTGLELMLANPIVGVGAGAFASASFNLHPDQLGAWHNAHNSFLQIGTELGFPGLILFTTLIFTTIKHLRRQAQTFANIPELEKIKWLPTALEISIYSYIITGFFLSQAYSSMFYFLVALTVILRRLELSPSYPALTPSELSSSDTP